MGAIFGFAYGVLAYALFFLTFLYAVGFVGNLGVPKAIDTGDPLGPFWPALLTNAVLLSLFAVQHSGMARPAFKRWWTRFVPWPLERSTYVLISSLLLILLFYAWQPLPGVVWSVESPVGIAVLSGLFWLGWLVVLASTFMINHFDLFGLRQVHYLLRRRECPSLPFRTTGLYAYVRHPIMLGFIVAFWATPRMSASHLLFAVATTGYILVGVWLEERDLLARFGGLYAVYRRQVPMLVPKGAGVTEQMLESEAAKAGATPR
jgi:protein-S-isoprenylcysteine O-methyltransferase Ste14